MWITVSKASQAGGRAPLSRPSRTWFAIVSSRQNPVSQRKCKIFESRKRCKVPKVWLQVQVASPSTKEFETDTRQSATRNRAAKIQTQPLFLHQRRKRNDENSFVQFKWLWCQTLEKNLNREPKNGDFYQRRVCRLRAVVDVDVVVHGGSVEWRRRWRMGPHNLCLHVRSSLNHFMFMNGTRKGSTQFENNCASLSFSLLDTDAAVTSISDLEGF